LGSPIYLGDVTALMRGFIERFGFMNTSYNDEKHKVFTGKINGAFIYTMNVPKPVSALFTYVYKFNTAMLKKLNGTVKQLISTDTWQFDDYSKYDASNFDVGKKKKARDALFPKDCEKAYGIGKDLISE
jgi:multimeric flavodoxin WrbA